MSETKKRDMWFWLAVFFGSGLAPKAPGTFGSLASLVVWAPMVLLGVSPWIRVVVALAIFVIGITAASRAAKILDNPDPKEVVIDEVAGQGLALTFASASVWSVVVGFALFRLFDVWKPWPIRVADRRIKGGFGIMLDDVLAGLIAAPLLVGFDIYILPHLLAAIAGGAS
jgi:phosphatidylglycerophosphatase A